MKDLTLYPEALELKELGFDEPCFGFYHEDKSITYTGIIGQNTNSFWLPSPNKIITAPTYSQAFRFFREKYGWQHSIQPTLDQLIGELGYNYWIWNNKTGEEYYTMPKNRPVGDWEYETYEESELECLKHLIKLINEKD